MQFDLLAPPQEVRKNVGKVRRKSPELLRVPIVEGEVRKNRTFPSLKVGEVRSTSPSTIRDQGAEGRQEPKQDKASQLRDAMFQRFELEQSLGVAGRAHDAAKDALAPYAAAFFRAHEALVAAKASSPKDECLALYDARLAAGHAKHPYADRAREAEQWEKRVLKELKEVNQLIERLSP